jgi:hypothetical protein
MIANSSNTNWKFASYVPIISCLIYILLRILRDYLTIEARFLTNASLCCSIGWAFPSSRPYYKTITATFLTIPALYPTTRRSEQKAHRVYE